VGGCALRRFTGTVPDKTGRLRCRLSERRRVVTSHDSYPSTIGQARSTLAISRSRAHDIEIVKLVGELDTLTAVDLRAELTALLSERPPPGVVEIDLAGVTFLDSLGLGTLVVGQRICAQLGVRLRVCSPSPFAERLLEVSGVRDQLIFPQRFSS
jgi:anti-sigma B factor antagonist